MSADLPKVLDGIELKGRINIEDDVLVANIASSIRRGLPQVWEQPMQPEEVCLVGGGPSLEATLPELRDLVFKGAKLVTTNGAYRWCIDRNLRPSAQLVLDGRESNARFVEPEIPQCRYFIASQCHPAVFDAVEGREWVAIWHAVNWEGKAKNTLDAYYLGRWLAINGGTTVGIRGLSLLLSLGYRRFHLFGIDSCYGPAGEHHAYPQPENDHQAPVEATVAPAGHPEMARTFRVSGWHLKQLEDWLQFIKVNGQHFLMQVHGDGLLAWAMQAGADVDMTLTDAA